MNTKSLPAWVLVRAHFRLWLMLGLSVLSALALAPHTQASIAYGSINNFDTVNDTGHECHGFEIELEDVHSTNITYTYNYNHYGVPKITEDNSNPAHPKVVIRWESKKNPDGSWAAYTAIPAGPIAPTDGHRFTNPAVNFGGEHFGAGYTVQPTAVRYRWLIDNGSGVLVDGGAVQVSTPSFVYYPPVAGDPAPAQVQAVIAPPPPPVPEPKEFGKAIWVKEIRTTTHNNKEVKLRNLISADPDKPERENWKNGEPDEVETEWQILQKDYKKEDGRNNKHQAAAEGLPGGDEVITRRYEFFKYVGPIDDESGEAMAESVAEDGIHGVGIKVINGVSVDLSTLVVVGDFTGSQMAAVDVAAPVGLIDHVGEGELNVAFTDRTVIVAGELPFTSVFEGLLPLGMNFDEVTGILSGTPTESGAFHFKITASDGVNPDVTKNYILNIADAGGALPPRNLLDTAVSPVGSGITTGDGVYALGADANVTATANAGYAFLNWTDNGTVVSTNSNYTQVMDVNHSLVANFVPGYAITTLAAPAAGGTTSGGGNVSVDASVTVIATPKPHYAFTNWTEDAVEVSTDASYNFTATGDRTLVAHFIPTTANQAPVAAPDTFDILPHSTNVPLAVLGNDSDPDEDTVSITSFSALAPKTAGTLTKSGNTLRFTASPTFTGNVTATFSYSINDGLGGTSTAPVTLPVGVFAINPDSAAVAAAATHYPVSVTTTALGAWRVQETLPWVSVDTSSGTGNDTFNVTLQPNTSKKERRGDIVIGDKIHTITQAAVRMPTLAQPSSVPMGIVGGYYELKVPTENFPVIYTVTQMPPGLTIDGNTGLITGVPAAGGSFDVTIRARNAAGAAVDAAEPENPAPKTLHLTIEIAHLDPRVVGTFHGFIGPEPGYNANMGSRLELVTTSRGACSGKLVTGAVSTPLKGSLNSNVDEPEKAHVQFAVPRKNATTLILDIQLAGNALAGNISDDVNPTPLLFSGWRNEWNPADHRATAYAGLYTFRLEQADTDDSLPQGWGYGSFKLRNEATGTMITTGKLADGNIFTSATFVGGDGQLLVYQSLYGGKGSLVGAAKIDLVAPQESSLGSSLQWFKPAPAENSKDTLYKPGFGPLTLAVKGSLYPTLAPGALLIDPPNGAAQIQFRSGGLDVAGISVNFSIINPSLTGKTNEPVIPANAYSLTMTKLDVAKGGLAGTFTIPGVPVTLSHKVPYQGQLVRGVDGIRGYGFFLLPESKAATAIKKSGSVLLRNRPEP